MPILTVSFDNASTTITPGSANFELDQDNGDKEVVLMSIHAFPVGLKNDVIIVNPNAKLKIKTSYKADKMSYCI